MTAHLSRFAEHVGHEIRAQVIGGVCACGMAPVDRSGRCEACADRTADLRYEAGREPVGGD